VNHVAALHNIGDPELVPGLQQALANAMNDHNAMVVPLSIGIVASGDTLSI
jgi:hypothetical protein